MAWQRIQGHDALRDRFVTAYERGRLGHAYLFVGPTGVGKKFFATELAKAMLCEASPSPLTACDRCAACLLVDASTHPDCLTARKPDDKMELPIDVIRELCVSFGLKPSRGVRKIAIVEDADDFNEESANAFLKTLEEPPSGSLIILLATSDEMQLSTIRSRCQIVRFRPLSNDTIRSILAGRDIVETKTVARLIRLAQGSVGQALAMNDDALWQFRSSLIAMLTSPKPNGHELATQWIALLEAAGKESAKQRQRASLSIKLCAEILSQILRLSEGLPAEGIDEDMLEKCEKFATRIGTESILERIEKCMEADRQVDRSVQLVLAIEALVDPLTRFDRM